MKVTVSIPRDPAGLAAMCGGRLFVRGHALPFPITRICTDSREADGETLFCAMRGERVDGHDYIPTAARAGCRTFLCEYLPEGWENISPESPFGEGPMFAIVVEDTVPALARLAAAVRAEALSEMQVVAVTGSVGKTTTKEMIAAVMAAASPRSYKKDGNFNSTVGLPLSVTEIPADTAHAVLEMGMSGRGEIAAMTAAARPDIALIINIGTSHMEQLGSRENIAAAKLEIAEGLREGGILLVNGDEPLLARAESVIPADTRVLRLTLADAPDADFSARSITPSAEGMSFDLATPDGVLSDLFVPAVGIHMVWAGAFAAAVGCLCGFDPAHVRAGLAAYRPAALRQSRRTVGNVTFIEDCYNAAPESMRAALDALELTAASSASARRIAVLGSMMALGEDSPARHREVGRALADRAPDLLVTVGELASHIADGARDGGLPSDRILVLGADIAPDAPNAPDPTDAYPAIAARIAERILPHDLLLFKASRAMRLEALADAVGACINK